MACVGKALDRQPKGNIFIIIKSAILILNKKLDYGPVLGAPRVVHSSPFRLPSCPPSRLIIIFTKTNRKKIKNIPGHTWVGLLGADQGSPVGDRAKPAKQFPVGFFFVSLVEGVLLPCTLRRSSSGH